MRRGELHIHLRGRERNVSLEGGLERDESLQRAGTLDPGAESSLAKGGAAMTLLQKHISRRKSTQAIHAGQPDARYGEVSVTRWRSDGTD